MIKFIKKYFKRKSEKDNDWLNSLDWKLAEFTKVDENEFDWE